MPKPDKSKYLYNPRQLHQELSQAGLNVVSVNSRGEVVLAKDPTPEQLSLIQSIKEKLNLEKNFRNRDNLALG